MKPPAEPKAKRAYQQPKLLKYGSLTDMTASNGTGPMNDNVPMTPMKTG
jgi:hypothetical protein